MLENLLIGLPTMLVCLSLQSILLISAIRYYHRNKYLVDSPSFWSSLVVITGVMTMLLFGNLAQIAIWAELFLFLEEFQRFDAAFYHSAVNFSTLGYGDIVMSEQQLKLLGETSVRTTLVLDPDQLLLQPGDQRIAGGLRRMVQGEYCFASP